MLCCIIMSFCFFLTWVQLIIVRPKAKIPNKLKVFAIFPIPCEIPHSLSPPQLFHTFTVGLIQSPFYWPSSCELFIQVQVWNYFLTTSCEWFQGPTISTFLDLWLDWVTRESSRSFPLGIINASTRSVMGHVLFNDEECPPRCRCLCRSRLNGCENAVKNSCGRKENSRIFTVKNEKPTFLLQFLPPPKTLWHLDLIGIGDPILGSRSPKKSREELAKRVKIALGYSAAGNGKRGKTKKDERVGQKENRRRVGFFLSLLLRAQRTIVVCGFYRVSSLFGTSW